MPRWLRWTLAIHGALLALLGAAYLVVHLIVPRLIEAHEQAQGIGLFDPTLGYDPVLRRPLDPVRTTVAALFVLTGVAQVAAARARRERLRRALVVAGALSLVPTSIALAFAARTRDDD